MCLNQLVFIISFNLMQSILVHLALRLLGGLHYLGYTKLLKLSTSEVSALGQFISFITTDHDRIQEAVSNAVMIINSPIMMILSVSYVSYLAGVSALSGIVVVLLFYPVMVR